MRSNKQTEKEVIGENENLNEYQQDYEKEKREKSRNYQKEYYEKRKFENIITELKQRIRELEKINSELKQRIIVHQQKLQQQGQTAYLPTQIIDHRYHQQLIYPTTQKQNSSYYPSANPTHKFSVRSQHISQESVQPHIQQPAPQGKAATIVKRQQLEPKNINQVQPPQYPFQQQQPVHLYSQDQQQLPDDISAHYYQSVSSQYRHPQQNTLIPNNLMAAQPLLVPMQERKNQESKLNNKVIQETEEVYQKPNRDYEKAKLAYIKANKVVQEKVQEKHEAYIEAKEKHEIYPRLAITYQEAELAFVEACKVAQGTKDDYQQAKKDSREEDTYQQSKKNFRKEYLSSLEARKNEANKDHSTIYENYSKAESLKQNNLEMKAGIPIDTINKSIIKAGELKQKVQQAEETTRLYDEAATLFLLKATKDKANKVSSDIYKNYSNAEYYKQRYLKDKDKYPEYKLNEYCEKSQILQQKFLNAYKQAEEAKNNYQQAKKNFLSSLEASKNEANKISSDINKAYLQANLIANNVKQQHEKEKTANPQAIIKKTIREVEVEVEVQILKDQNLRANQQAKEVTRVYHDAEAAILFPQHRKNEANKISSSRKRVRQLATAEETNTNLKKPKT